MKLTKEIRKYLSRIGKEGGEKNKLKGREYFSKIGKKGATKRWGKKRLISDLGKT